MSSVMQVIHQGGGAGSVTSTLHLSIGLSKAGFDVTLVCPPGSEVEESARKRGLQVLPLALEPRRPRKNARKLAELLERHPVQLINSQSSRDRAALAWLALTGRLRIPLVVTRRQMPRTVWLENWLVSRVSSRVVAVSRAIGEALVRRGTPASKLVIIPNGLVTDRVDAPMAPGAVDLWRARIGWETSRRTIGIVGRRKDQEVVLRALHQVATPVRLVLVGMEPDTRLTRLTSGISSRHAVVWLPFTSYVRPIYELLELILLPSRMEGLSQALLEAMALGKPVLASAAAGNLDLITDGVDGRLVDPVNPAAWALSIEALLSSPATAQTLGAAAVRTARDTFSLEQTVARTASLYRTLLGAV